MSRIMGINLEEELYYTRQYMFLNIAKLAPGWGGQGSTAGVNSDVDMDSLYYPRSMNLPNHPGDRHTKITSGNLIQNGLPMPSGHYVVLWTSKIGDIANCPGPTLSGGATLVSSAPGRAVYNVTDVFSIDHTNLDPLGNGNYPDTLGVIYSPDSDTGTVGTREALYNSGEIIDPDFVLATSQFAGRRGMDYFHTNGNPCGTDADWANRLTKDHSFWCTPWIGTGPNDSAAPYGVNLFSPVDVFLEMLNKQPGSIGWFNMPAGSSVGFRTGFAQLVYDNMKANNFTKLSLAIVEYSNELWNFSSNWGKLVADGYATFPGIVGDDFSAGFQYGKYMAVQTAAIWKSVFGADYKRGASDTRLITVVGGQGGYTDRNISILDTVATDVGGDGSLWIGKVSDNIDAMCIAVYWGNSVGHCVDAAFAATGLTNGPGAYAALNTTDKATIDDWITANLTTTDVIGYDTTEMNNLPALLDSDFNAISTIRGVPIMVYEWGTSNSDTGGLENCQPAVDLMIAAERLQALGDQVANVAAMIDQHLSMPLAMYFNFAGAYSKWGCWGAYEYTGQSPTPPKAQALLDHQASPGAGWGWTGRARSHHQLTLKISPTA